MMKTYRELDVWKKSVDMVVSAYELTEKFPDRERYGLTGQLRRAAVSIPANIAEGYGRTHRGDYLHHLSIARGSLAELETHLAIAVRLGFIPREEAVSLWGMAQDVSKMLTRLVQSLQKAATKSARSKPDIQEPAV